MIVDTPHGPALIQRVSVIPPTTVVRWDITWKIVFED